MHGSLDWLFILVYFKFICASLGALLFIGIGLWIAWEWRRKK